MKSFKLKWLLLLLVSGSLLLATCSDPDEPAPAPQTVTITFDVDGGTPAEIAPITILPDTEMGDKYPANPKKTDSLFSGWFEDGTRYTKTTKVTHDITLKARWAHTGDPLSIMDIPSLYEQFEPYFLFGNIVRSSGDITSGALQERLLLHYNVLSAENDMKPSYYSGSSLSGTTVNIPSSAWNVPDRFVNAAEAAGVKILAHVLLWHQQIPGWQLQLATNATSKDDTIAIMEDWITKVVTHYKGRVWAWDVLNEVFPDNVNSAQWQTNMRTTGDGQAPNPWFVKIGYEFVYLAYRAARLADPGAILYYNDYNLDTVNKSTAVANMVKDANDKWKDDPAYDGRNLIEGIGMQSHHNLGVTAAQIKASLDRFRPLGVRISISELDILSYANYSQFSSGPGAGAGRAPQNTSTQAQKDSQAVRYGEYFKLFLENSDIIERVTFWGVNDETSWRSGGLPLIFNGAGTAASPIMIKPAYWEIQKALIEYEDSL